MKKNLFSSSFMYADSLPSFDWRVDISDKSFYCDSKMNAILGLPNDQNMSIAQLLGRIDERQRQKVKDSLSRTLQNNKPFTMRVILAGDGERYLIDFEIISCVKGSIVGKIVFLLLFPTQAQELELLNLLFKNGNTGFIVAGSDHTILMVNKAYCMASGYSEGELIGQHGSILKSGGYNKKFYTELWNKVDLNKSWSGELLAKTKAGKRYIHEVHLKRLELLDNSHFYFSTSNKIEGSSNKLSNDASTDTVVSSVLSKKKYLAMLGSAFENLSSDNTIVMASFQINMLQKRDPATKSWLIAQRFNSLSHKGVIGELNKDSLHESVFSLFWVEPKGVDYIDKMLLKTLKELTGEQTGDDLSLSSIINMGVSVLNIDAQSPSQLIKNSMQTLTAHPMLNDSALFYFDVRLSKRFDDRKILASLLKVAIDEKQIVVFYQPIICIPLLRTVGFEALVRFNLKTKIKYDTQLLIEIAEDYNWIDQVDHLVTEVALRDLMVMQKEFNRPNLGMSINRSLVNDKISKCSLEETISILESTEVNLKNITIELLESARFANAGQQKLWVEKLQKMGAKIAIDDFGKGFASFDYIESLPIDYIKIASDFISGLTEHSRKYSVIEAITKLAHKIGAKVIAEGVETEEELILLSRANVDEVQGYLFAKPTNLEELIKNKDKTFSAHLKPLVYNETARTVKTVRDIALKSFSTIEMDNRLELVVEKMNAANIDYFVVLEKELYQGILYRTDINAALSPYLGTKGEKHRDLLTLDKRVHQVMKNMMHSLHIDTPISKAEQLFLDFPKAIIILFEIEGTCIGVTTIEELLRNKLKVSTHEDLVDDYYI